LSGRRFAHTIGRMMNLDSRKIDTDKPTSDYEKPSIRDYGELQQLTAAHTTGNTTDVPKGTTSPSHSVFC